MAVSLSIEKSSTIISINGIDRSKLRSSSKIIHLAIIPQSVLKFPKHCFSLGGDGNSNDEPAGLGKISTLNIESIVIVVAGGGVIL